MINLRHSERQNHNGWQLEAGTATENKYSLRSMSDPELLGEKQQIWSGVELYSSQVQGGYFSAASYFSLQQVEEKQTFKVFLVSLPSSPLSCEHCSLATKCSVKLI